MKTPLRILHLEDDPNDTELLQAMLEKDGLPAELLPDGWIGIRAAGLFFALRERLEEPARAYVRAVTSG